jgi:hypothetical protein
MQNKTRLLTISALCCAAGTALLCLASILPAGVAGIVLLASAGAAATRVYAGEKWAWICFAATAILAWVLPPSRFPALLYTAFMGYYPLIVLRLERIRGKPVRWAVRIVIFNAAAVAMFYLASSFFPDRITSASGRPWLFLLAGNVLFLLYDRAVRELLLFCIRTIVRRT